jgi:putative heme-binding domain-containing protein
VALISWIASAAGSPAWAQSSSLEQTLLAEPGGDLAADARELGDASRGALLFHLPGMGCVRCHDGGPDSLGPDLSSWSRRVDDLHLVESVLRPSARIEDRYRSRLIVTADGRTLAGIERARDSRSITLQTGVTRTELVSIELAEIELDQPSEVSIMPSGQVNALRRRQDFLDLVAYLIAIRDGGAEAALRLRPSELALRSQLPAAETNLDHRGMIEDWDQQSLQRGAEIYQRLCVNCHGTIDEPGSLPTSLRFASGKFKFGSDPYSIYQTLTHGGGLMLPQTWMVPQQKYDVVHYLREHFLRERNPSQFAAITEPYLAGLPAGDSRGPAPSEFEPWTMMDYGPMLITTIEISDASNIAQKAIAMRLDPGPGGISQGRAWIAFEHDTLRMAAAWTGEFVDWNGIQFNGRHGVHLRASGAIQAANPTGPGWANPLTGSFDDSARVTGRDGRRYGPLPAEWGKFRGLYRYEDEVVLHYSVGSSEILERQAVLPAEPAPLFARTINIGPRTTDLELAVLTTDQDATVEASGEDILVRSADRVWLVSAPGLAPAQDFRLEQGRLVLRLAQGTTPLQGTVLFTLLPLDEAVQPRLSDQAARLDVDLSDKIRGGPPQHADPIEVPVRTWHQSAAWSVEELVRPEGNPWLARTRITGIDFYPDGKSLAVCTWDGDVWRVDGLESIAPPPGGSSEPASETGSLRWRRIARGLFQPLGILVEDDCLMVTCRDQLLRLMDVNGDGEMDDYRCFNSDHQVTEHFHEFAMGLQRDSQGNYYYAKSARHALPAVVPHHGTLLRVTPDGGRTEIVATGFRAANGVCLNDDGSFVVTDQEGHWNPKNRINWVRPGGFYGNMYGYHEVTDSSDQAMEQPLCWITNEFDRSPAELLWVRSDRWGPLRGQLLNLSYGYGRIYVVPYELRPTAAGTLQAQGGMCALPIPDLPTGIIRGRFSPLDGQLYVAGMFSWAGSRQEQEGGLFRVRYRGHSVDLPLGLRARPGEIEIDFSDPLDRSAASEPDRYEVTAWDLQRTREYGSEHFNQRALTIQSAELAADDRTVRLRIDQLQPTWGMEIRCRLKTVDGREVRRVIHNTIHQLDDPPGS